MTGTEQHHRPDRPDRQVRLARREFVRAHHSDTGGDPEVFWRGLQAFDRPGPGSCRLRVVAVRSHRPLLLDWRAGYRAGRTDAWDSTIVRVIAAAVALVGLLLLAAQLKPRRVRRLKVSSQDANTDAALTRAGVRSALRRAATDVDGINSAKVKLGRRTAKVTASSRASQAGLAQDLNTEVGTAVADRLASLQLRHAPRARTSVQTRKVRS